MTAIAPGDTVLAPLPEAPVSTLETIGTPFLWTATRDDRRGEEHPEHQTGHVSHSGGISTSLRADADTDASRKGPGS